MSHVGMMQIAEADTHQDYVICRGYDPEEQRFYNEIAVGKPYGVRGTYPYSIAEVYPAIKPMTRIGRTPGMAETTVGHPVDLDETVEILTDDDDGPINWLLLDEGRGHIWIRSTGAWTNRGLVHQVNVGEWDSSANSPVFDDLVTTYPAIDWCRGATRPDGAGWWGQAEWLPSPTGRVLNVLWWDCEGP